ncbi:MAG: hypothetical protein CMM74_06055 [Rhodospirillaceae bacterium]|nr:hypothetical protein [Rhodospirillaceae bacterium]
MPKSDTLSHTIDAAQVTPLYHQVRLVLRESIINGAYIAGELLPTEDELCRQFGVSTTTIKSALKELVNDGMVSRQQGRGTFVTDQVVQSRSWSKVIRLIEQVTAIGEATGIGERDSVVIEPDKNLRQIFGLSAEGRLWRDRHIRLLAGKPLGRITALVPADIAENFVSVGAEDQPVLLKIEGAGVEVAKADQSVGATIADPVLAHQLKIEPGAAIVRLHRRVMDVSGRVVEDLTALYRADYYEYRTELRRYSGDEDSSAPNPWAFP